MRLGKAIKAELGQAIENQIAIAAITNDVLVEFRAAINRMQGTDLSGCREDIGKGCAPSQ